MAPSRSRRRKSSQSQPTLQTEDGESEIDDETVEENIGYHAEHSIEGSDDEEHVVDPEKEREIWEAIREDHFEVFDQLPLTLHRQYTLLKELEQQSNGFMNDLLPTVKRYIALRKSLDTQIKAEQVARTQQQSTQTGQEVVTQKDGEDVPMEVDAGAPSSTSAVDNLDPPSNYPPIVYPKQTTPPPTTVISNVSLGTPPRGTTTSTASALPRTPIRAIPPHMNNFELRTPIRTPTPTSIPQERVKVPETSREMLSHIAWLTEEMVRTANEKVHLAQAAHDTLERQIRVLGQSIKEQEMALSLGARPGTQLAPILLPEVIAPLPRWTKPVTNTEDMDSDDDEIANGSLYDANPATGDGTTTLGIVDDNMSSLTQSTFSRKKNRKKKFGNKKSQEHPDVKRPLTITLPPADSEKKYCHCNRVSFGEMVGCDNGENCDIEWFHLNCVGLTHLPSEDQPWYCRDCKPKIQRKRRR
ncbi:hypothetical protein E1B28_007173 [Marasmius oreades]|uniref:Chromatin modification-related protein n=1 Tax=Marasmius oreades TaxID=181124 RepID=A0A9P7UTI2_9AGAR|nr:uncharacterized protein E1B28_007173 [Marasmius oreades]KAG7093498.1 hypothetical protein E1B28_007173 [Marasmius oreades]